MIHLDGVDHVTNENGWLYQEGADVESVENFRERIKESWSELAELTTEDKLRNVAKKVSGVLDVKIDAQHPRGQGTTDIIVTGTGGEATKELLQKVEAATSYLKGSYDDFLYKSSVVIYQDIIITLYIAREADTDEAETAAESIITDVMQLNKREEINCLYMDDIRYALKKCVASCKRVEFAAPIEDIELDKNEVVMLGKLEVTAYNIGGA